MASEYGANATITGSLNVDGNIDLGSGDDDIDLDNNTLFVDADQDKVGIGLTNPSHKFDVNGDIRIRGNDIRDNSGNSAISFDGSANTEINGTLSVSGSLSHEDFILAELSIPGVDLQTDTNAFRFNCPYNLNVEGLLLAIDQHTTSGNVTVTVTNSTDANQMISLSITGTNQSANTSTVSNAQCDQGDVITVAITATPANAQGLRMALQFRRRL
jgi:hypothetical protein